MSMLIGISIAISLLALVTVTTAIYIDEGGFDLSDGDEIGGLIVIIIICAIPAINIALALYGMHSCATLQKQHKKKLLKKFNRFVQCQHRDCGLYFREGHILLFSENLTERTCPSCERKINKEVSDLEIETDIDFSPFIPYSACKKLHKHFKGKKNVYFANQQSKMYNEQQLARMTKLRDEMERERQERNGELGLPKEIDEILQHKKN